MRSFTLISCWFISLYCNSPWLQAQVQQYDRFELPLYGATTPFDVTSLESNGLLLHRRLTTPVQDQFEIAKLDTVYQQVWHGFIPLERNFIISHTRIHNSTFCLLLRGKDFYDFRLISIDESTGKYAQYDFRNYIPFLPTIFEINDQAAIIGGYYNQVPIVVFFDFTTLKFKILPGLFNEIGQLEQIKIHEDNTFDILLCARYFNREKTIWIKSYSPEGDFINQVVLPVEGNKNLLFGTLVKTPDDMKIVAGVYGNRNSEYSKGLFVASIDPFGEKQLRYHNFADLENFFGYMKANREKRVKGRIERRKIKGKNNRFNYRLLVHELIRYKQQFILLGEAFYPKYQSSSRSPSGFFGTSRSSTYGSDLVFDGFRYTHATILGFDANGTLLWDNSFEINDVKTFNKEQFVKLRAHDDKITLLYLHDNQLRSKVISGHMVLEGKTTKPIKTLYQGDMSEEAKATLTKLEYWYDDYLFAYGVQEIININQEGHQSKRNVFFINKLKCK